MAEIAPCPFHDFASPCELSSNGVENIFVECMTCGACGPAHDSEAVAIAAWNCAARYVPVAGTKETPK